MGGCPSGPIPSLGGGVDQRPGWPGREATSGWPAGPIPQSGLGGPIGGWDSQRERSQEVGGSAAVCVIATGHFSHSCRSGHSTVPVAWLSYI